MNSEFGIRYRGTTVKGQSILNAERAKADELLTKEQVVEMVRSRFAYLGDQSRWAESKSLTPAEVSHAATGRYIRPRVLEALGLEKVVMYRRKR